MKTTDLFQSILLFALFLCGLTACNDSDEIRLSPFQETTVKGEASTLQIDLTRGDWRITSITTPWGDLMMDGNKLPQLEGTGSLHYKWWDLERDTDSHLILHFKDNFDLGESRSLIINLEMKTGLYKEQIISPGISTHCRHRQHGPNSKKGIPPSQPVHLSLSS